MSREQMDAFLERRARVLRKHAAQDPKWQALQKARRPKPLAVLGGTLAALAVLAALGKSVLLAHHGPDGYAALVAPLVEAAADIPILPLLLAADPATLALASVIDPARRVAAQMAEAPQAPAEPDPAPQ